LFLHQLLLVCSIFKLIVGSLLFLLLISSLLLLLLLLLLLEDLLLAVVRLLTVISLRSIWLLLCSNVGLILQSKQ
jgi:hypothetical protein